MEIFVENSAGRIKLPAENSKHNLLFYNSILVLSLLDKESAWLNSDGYDDTFLGPGEFKFPIKWDEVNTCVVSVKQNTEFYKYFFHLENTVVFSDEEIINLLRFVSQMERVFHLDQEYDINEIFDAITKNQVSLIIEKTPYTGYDDQSLLKKIYETVPRVMDICSHPKQSLRTEEAVLDVNLVKRVNSRTMDHLASHSENWKMRNLNGLLPNRLRADIFEDEINIYENLFFRLAVDDILKYVHRQAISIERTIQQNDEAIDWNAYGEALYDYKRMQIFRQLVPDYDAGERQNKNKVLRELLDQWKKLEKNFSTIEASQFYRSIDKKKHISRNIQPTNILKKDSRYNALYRLWCEIQRQRVQEQQESINLKGKKKIRLADSYSMYVTVMILYAFKLLEYDVESESKFKICQDGTIQVNAVFESREMAYFLKTEKNKYGTLEIQINFVEKVGCDYHIPQEALNYLKDIKKALPNRAIIDEVEQRIVFFAKPTAEEQRNIKNIFHINQAAKKGMADKEKEGKKRADRIWRHELEDFFASGKIKDAQIETIKINPQFIVIDSTETAIEKYTNSVLDSADGSMIYIFPIEIGDYKRTVKSERLINRLINYGEKYYEEDALQWGNYRTGIIPVAQSEISSAQRLMKLISIHTSRLQIKWNKKMITCPICGSLDCQEVNTNNWRCKNPDCKVIFGITRHADGCGMDYEWTRPFVDIKKKDVMVENQMDLLIRKEIIFDRLAITDFEFEEQLDGTVKYIPICPKCGKRSMKKNKL